MENIDLNPHFLAKMAEASNADHKPPANYFEKINTKL